MIRDSAKNMVTEGGRYYYVVVGERNNKEDLSCKSSPTSTSGRVMQAACSRTTASRLLLMGQAPWHRNQLHRHPGRQAAYCATVLPGAIQDFRQSFQGDQIRTYSM